MLSHSPNTFSTHRDFRDALHAIAGQDRAAKLKLIDKHDDIRKHGGGRAAGDLWLQYEAERHDNLLHHVLSVTRDDAARRIIESAINKGDIKKQMWMKSRLTEKMIADAAQYANITDDGIKEQTKTLLERRRLRFKVKQSVSAINLAVGATGGKTGFPLCTPYEMAMRKTQKANQEEWADETWIYCQALSKIVSMADIIATAGKKRVAEILALAKGLQEFGEKHGLVPVFYTITAPPRMHPNPTMGRNSWDGTTPREAQAWIHTKHRSALLARVEYR